ncbi:MAG: hypothetical protein LQ342_001220 [Letrouitia transgressa]|nr:MAG: hypothetical protein LQ342_001220 [Letrouitia transgressa]
MPQQPRPAPWARLKVTLTASQPTVSLSQNTNNPTAPLHLILNARIVSSSNPSSAITLCTDGSVLDNGQHTRHDGLFWGAISPLQSTLDPSRRIPLRFHGWPNYGSYDASPNLRERPWTRFETVPPPGKGELVIKHQLSLERIFRHSHQLKAADVHPGEEFCVRINPKRLRGIGGWWTFGDLSGDLEGKKFAKWELPDDAGEIGNLMPGEQFPDIEQMEREGWVFSQMFDSLGVTEDLPQEEVTIKFAK